MVTWRAGPQIAAYLEETFAGVDCDGNIRAHDADLDRINLTRRGLGTGIYHERAFEARERIAAARYHREAFIAASSCSQENWIRKPSLRQHPHFQQNPPIAAVRTARPRSRNRTFSGG
jgi:hypothetical protein